jgi:hypothetical protein
MTVNIYENDIENLPKAVFVNANNKGYCRIKLDKASLKHLEFDGTNHRIFEITNTANRFYLWRTLAD